ncbi:hypothetical protein PR202_ga18823 [Eleusine coracana subsp. coracana]|uniref:Uncharacterized protein n=1 Tax=Eleusine coracana subsp. coracana TaxID=191504 RepID=A0AAV5CTY5_ELECO|nr:hypothetical protein PR202_ga18823 [Eleusine coracana subsp. coracana]
MSRLAPSPNSDCFQDWWRRANKRTTKEVRRGLNSFDILVAWELWKQRNRCVFDAAQPQVHTLVKHIKEEATLWAAAGAKKLARLLP